MVAGISPPLIVGVTGNAMPDQVQDFLNHGVHTVLAKPLTLPMLMNTLVIHGVVKPEQAVGPELV